MPKVSFIVPARNKAHFVAETVNSVLAQTYEDMEILLSDQGSTDGTFEIMSDLANKYNGKATVRVLQCPHTELKGMAGLNEHLNWLHEQINGEIVVMCSADDLNHPDRVKYTVEAFEKHNPSYVGTCVQYLDADKNWHGEVTAYSEENSFVTPEDNVDKLVGSSASSAWPKDLFDKYGPMRGVESQDILLPFFATLERGLFYVSKPLHAYIRHADENNTGLGGVLLSAKTEEDKLAWTETNNYHYTSNFLAILRRIQQMGINLTESLEASLLRKIIEGANIWAISRDAITLKRIEPKAMRV